MKLPLNVFAIFVLHTSLINAQSVIKGKVLDSTGVAMQFASVALLKASDSTLVKGSVCNDLGEYIFERTSAGNFIVKALALGAPPAYSLSFYSDSLHVFEVPSLIVKLKAKMLNEAAVTEIKQAIEFKDGAVVMNVEDNPVNAGNTGLELLAKIPGVIIDNEGNVSLDGKQGVSIMIDGRMQRLSGQQLVSLLSSMSSENISKIVVMKNPPAKYDAAGSAGMIDIISKKVKVTGWSGSISASGSKGHRYNGSTDGSLNYKGKRLTLFSNFGYSDNMNYRPYIWNKMVPADSGVTELDETGIQYFYAKSLRYKAAFTYDLSEKTTAGILVSGGPGSNPYEDKGVNQIKGYNNLGFDHSPYTNKTEDNWSNPNYNVNLEHRFDTSGTVLNFSADYSNFNGKAMATNNNFFLNSADIASLPDKVFRTTRNNNIIISTQKLDYTRNLSKKLLLEAGVKNTSVNSSSDYIFERQDNLTGVYVPDTTISNQSQYFEKVMAGYVSFRKEIKNGSLQTGCRGENTNSIVNNKSEGYERSRNYFNFFPNISFTYSRSEKHNFQFNISRRIDRPNYKDLNPYILYMDNYTRYIGNPDLHPQTGYKFSGAYTYRKALTNTLSYTHYDDGMFGYEYQNDSDQTSIGTVKNLKKSEYYSYDLFLQKKFVKWWNCTFSSSIFYSLFEGTLEGAPFKRTILSGNANIQNDIILPNKYKINLNAFYYGPNNAGTDHNEGFWSMTAGIKKNMLKDQLLVSLAVSDIFRTMVFHTTSKFLTQDYYMLMEPDVRRIRLALQYRFGKVRIQNRQVSSNDDEKNRLENR